jgi:hypothetical protein
VSPVDEDEEWLIEYFDGATADLHEVDISWVKRNENRDMRDNPHVYTDMPSESAPPILVDSDGMIEDGQHRYESAKKRGDKKILAYVIK